MICRKAHETSVRKSLHKSLILTNGLVKKMKYVPERRPAFVCVEKLLREYHLHITTFELYVVPV